MNNNLLTLIECLDRDKICVAVHEKMIMEIICDAIKDIIPDIKWRYGYPDDPDIMIFYSENMAKDFIDDRKEVSNNNWRLYSVIENVFPELKYTTDDNYIYLSDEERFKIINKLKNLRES